MSQQRVFPFSPEGGKTVCRLAEGEVPGLVSLDPESAHECLAVSDDKTSVTFKDSSKETANGNGVYSILGHEGIISGCSYWELEIRNAERSEWALGVCRRDVERKGWHQEGPEKEFWVVGMYEKHSVPSLLMENTLCQFPRG
ncbi:butyrophilin subfamily 3 member A1-like isoform X1 [Mustela lutreola]|uniref:Butyrophilin subfamily 3 member A1-like isoform X1 n=1 Tax=Mustela putorius furo TaxID=9669 RepID=A0A8U0NNI8_MUSPF|nr:butyrophilin subfamily 3 member A1-like isoform X1 [Mustela putorius furo]XP_059034771.1 butyrophilin subfamily 3 member A1-like isoform X1 [Mustela lutreola]